MALTKRQRADLSPDIYAEAFEDTSVNRAVFPGAATAMEYFDSLPVEGEEHSPAARTTLTEEDLQRRQEDAERRLAIFETQHKPATVNSDLPTSRRKVYSGVAGLELLEEEKEAGRAKFKKSIADEKSYREFVIKMYPDLPKPENFPSFSVYRDAWNFEWNLLDHKMLREQWKK